MTCPVCGKGILVYTQKKSEPIGTKATNGKGERDAERIKNS